jgi:hypothetical protein
VNRAEVHDELRRFSAAAVGPQGTAKNASAAGDVTRLAETACERFPFIDGAAKIVTGRRPERKGL